MSYEEDDTVVLHDKHSEFDGEEGTITQVMESMFGDANYTISFEDGQEAGVPEDSLELVESGEAADEADDESGLDDESGADDESGLDDESGADDESDADAESDGDGSDEATIDADDA